MNPLQIFLAWALVMIAAVVAVLWWQLARAARQAASLHGQNEEAIEAPLVQVFKEQLADLEQQRQAGELDDARFAQAKAELEMRLMADIEADEAAQGRHASAHALSWPQQWTGRRLAWSLLALMPVLVLGGYLVLGHPMAMVPQQAVEANSPVTPEQLDAMAKGLRDKLAQDPQQIEGWTLLARVERARGQFDAADQALQKALAIERTPELWLERAEVLAQKQNGKFTGEPWQLIRQVLREAPQNANALILAGTASFNDGKPADAEGYWLEAQKHLPPQSPDAQPLARAIDQARAAQGKPPMAQAQPQPQPGAANARVVVRVEVSPAAKQQFAPGDAVFVYAQAPGQRMPLAVARTTVGELPKTFELTDAMAMAPGQGVSSVPQVRVSARISKSGNAIAQPGDWGQGVDNVPTVGGNPIAITITGPLK